MDPIDALGRCGGIATSAELRHLTSRSALSASVLAGLVVSPHRGVWALASIDEHRRRAAELSGVLSHLSAARAWGWKVKSVGDPWVTVPRNRTVLRARAVHVVYATLDAGDVVDGRTSPLRTVIDCSRRLPFDEALAVADSALRSGLVGIEEFRRAAERLKGKGCGAARTVADRASGLAANPHESVLRAHCLQVRGLRMSPQVRLDLGTDGVRPDLVDVRRRLVVEAESFEWHGSRERYRRDVERYTLMVANGWTVLRFTWEQVMLRPAEVLGLLEATLHLPSVRVRGGKQAGSGSIPPDPPLFAR
jgi:very-short-patch-repair endonuclease